MPREGIPVFVGVGQANSGRRSEGIAGKVGVWAERSSIECLSVTAQARYGSGHCQSTTLSILSRLLSGDPLPN